MKSFVLMISIFGLLVSCSDLDKQEQLKSVKKELTRLQLLSKKIEDKRLNDVATFRINTMQTELKIKQNLYLDTINLELARQLDAFKIMRRSIKPVVKQRQQLKKGINEEKKVLESLYQDIEQGRGERNRYDEFILFEHNKVEQLTALTADYMRAKSKLYNEYYRLYPPVNALANELVAKASKRR